MGAVKNIIRITLTVAMVVAVGVTARSLSVEMHRTPSLAVITSKQADQLQNKTKKKTDTPKKTDDTSGDIAAPSSGAASGAEDSTAQQDQADTYVEDTTPRISYIGSLQGVHVSCYYGSSPSTAVDLGDASIWIENQKAGMTIQYMIEVSGVNFSDHPYSFQTVGALPLGTLTQYISAYKGSPDTTVGGFTIQRPHPAFKVRVTVISPNRLSTGWYSVPAAVQPSCI